MIFSYKNTHSTEPRKRNGTKGRRRGDERFLPLIRRTKASADMAAINRIRQTPRVPKSSPRRAASLMSPPPIPPWVIQAAANKMSPPFRKPITACRIRRLTGSRLVDAVSGRDKRHQKKKIASA